jgi:hypothetical protein
MIKPVKLSLRAFKATIGTTKLTSGTTKVTSDKSNGACNRINLPPRGLFQIIVFVVVMFSKAYSPINNLDIYKAETVSHRNPD